MTELTHSHESQPHLQLERLTRGEAGRGQDELVRLARLIPEVTYSVEDILAERKSDGRDLSSKWDHSYVLKEGGVIVGFVMGYLRSAEANAQYPIDSLYMSELAVDPAYQGMGYAKKLIERYLKDGLQEGVDNFTLQTNAADWNEPVRRLYKRFGFQIDGMKSYENREDVIMRVTADRLERYFDENH